MQVEIMDMTTACQSFPNLCENYIDRSNMLDTIDSILQGNADIVIVEGEAGIGKSTLLSEFSKRHPMNSISFFINPSSKYGYDPELVKFDICNQINWLLTRIELNSSDNIDDGFFRTQLIELQRRARRNNEIFYFVIDGIYEIPEENKYIRDIIFDILPFGINGFKFIFSSEDFVVFKEIVENKRIQHKSFPLSAFTFEQTQKYFENFNLNYNLLLDIHKISKGKPGYLASLYRLIKSGVNADQLMENLDDHLPDPFDWEWNQVDKNNKKLLKLLALLANDILNLDLQVITQVVGYETIDILKSDIDKLTFISLTNETVTFASDVYRKYVAKQLKYMKEEVENLITDYLIKEPVGEETYKYLPGLLERSGKNEELVNFLSSDNYYNLLGRTQSLGLLNQVTEWGVKASRNLNRDGDLFRFSVQNSVIKDSLMSRVWISEVKARMALNEYESALSLTQNSILIEDRLHMLAIIAKHKKLEGLTPEPAIIEQINNLYSKIDYKKIGNKAVEIASELVYSNPDMAIGLMEKLTESYKKENALDWALASLSVVALNGEENRSIETYEDIKSKIKDPDAKLFSTEVSLLVRDYQAREIISEVEQLESTSDKLFLLANWASNNKKIEGAENVIEYGLNLAVSTTEYAPNAKIYKDLASQLPYIEDYEVISKIVGLFDTQQINIQRSGPTEDYITLQLTLFKAQSRFDIKKASSRIIDLYFYINEINDISILAVGLAKVLAIITEIDTDKTLESTEGLHSTVYKDLDTQLEKILSNSASHFHETKNVIKALAKSVPMKGLDLISRLNTETKRDDSYFVFIDSYLDSDSIVDYTIVYDVINKIVNGDTRDQAIVTTVENILRFQDNITDIEISVLIPILDKISAMKDLEQKIKCCCITYSILKKSSKYFSLGERYLEELNFSWESIDLGWKKIDEGYKIVEFLAKDSMEEARKYLKMTESLREETTLTDSKMSWVYKYSLLLSIRVYIGLVIKGIDSNEDFKKIERYIDFIPSYGEKALLWNDLSLKLFENKKIERFHEIVRGKIKPAIKEISDYDKRYKHHVLTKIAPSLYLSHKLTAFDIFDGMEQSNRDIAFNNIANYLLYKKSPYDPIDSPPGEGGNLSYEEVLDICELIERVTVDYLIYSLIKEIADSIVSSKRRHSFSKEQKFDITARLTTIIENKLPVQNYIKHDGYLLISKAEVLRIKPNTTIANWEELLRVAESIPNTSDKCLVLSIISAYLPRKKMDSINRNIDKIGEIIETIPTTLDKMEQYEGLASSILKINTPMSRVFLKKAMEVASGSPKSEVYTAQKRVIDLAHRIDSDFAASLVSLSDDDPAKRTINKELNNQLRTLELKNKMLNNDTAIAEDYSNYIQASWRLLGSLNAKRVETIHIENTHEFLEVASKLPLDEAFPIYSWILENAVVRYSTTDQAVSYLRPLFESSIHGVDLCLKLSTNSRDKLTFIKNNIKIESKNSILIMTGERTNALSYIKSWFEKELGDYIKICDPYFGPNDLELLQIIRAIKPSCQIQILTSKKHHDNEKIYDNLEQEYESYWRFNISDQDPPETTIVVVGTKTSGVLPIHDRWWLTNGKGLRMGTSFNSLGHRETEISILDKAEAKEREVEVDKYLNRMEREFKGDRLVYRLFDLY